MFKKVTKKLDGKRRILADDEELDKLEKDKVDETVENTHNETAAKQETYLLDESTSGPQIEQQQK